MRNFVPKICQQIVSTNYCRKIEVANLKNCLSHQNYRGIHSSAAIGNITNVATKRFSSQNERREFVAVFPDIVRDLTHISSHSDIPSTQKWLAKVLQYNGRDGKMNRGLAVVASHKLLTPSGHPSDESIYKARILGWCVELLQGFFMVADDIMDGSQTRRGKPCWYVKDNLGPSAFNDAILLEASVYKLLHKNFRDEPYYINVLELFHNITFKTSLGQCLDLHSSATDQRPSLSQFSIEKYNAIVKYKTAYYSFFLPVAIAMYMNNIENTELHRQAETILLEMGNLFQIQDDYLDCYGDPSVTGKIGTDIAEGKCSWLAVVALQRASSKQKKIMEDNYGINDAQCIQNIVQLYKELGLSRVFLNYEETTTSLIRKHIHQISEGLNHKVFFNFLKKIEGRSS